MTSFLIPFSALLACLFLVACATPQNDTMPAEPLNATGTPSPLNTSANPWTNVNPKIQGQYQTQRQGP